MIRKNEVLVVLILLLCSISVSAACGLKDFVWTGSYKNYNITGSEECYNTTINVTAGSEIRVLSGGSLYTENVRLNFSGAGSAIYISGVFVRGGNFTAVNTTFKGYGTNLYSTLNVTDGGIVNLIDVLFYNPGYYTMYGYDGIACSDSTFYMSNVSIYGNQQNAGINFTGCNVVIDDSLINGTYYGIRAIGSNLSVNNSIFRAIHYKSFLVSDASSLSIYDSLFDGRNDIFYKYGIYADNLSSVVIDNVTVLNYRNGSIGVFDVSNVNINNSIFHTTYQNAGVKVYNSEAVLINNLYIYNHSNGGLLIGGADYIDVSNVSINDTTKSIVLSYIESGNMTYFFVRNDSSTAVTVSKSQLNYISKFTIDNVSKNGLEMVLSNISGEVSFGNITDVGYTGIYLDNSDIGNNTLTDIIISYNTYGIRIFGEGAKLVGRNIGIYYPELGAFITDGVADVDAFINSFVYGDLGTVEDLNDEVTYVDISTIGANTYAAYNPDGIGGGPYSVGSYQSYHSNVDLPISAETTFALTTVGNGPGNENMSLFSTVYEDWMGGRNLGYYHWETSYAIFGTDIYYAVKDANYEWNIIKHNMVSDTWESRPLGVTGITNVTGVYNYNDKILVFGPTASHQDNEDGLYQLHQFTPLTLAYDGCLTCGKTGDYLMKVHYTKHSDYSATGDDDPCDGSTYCLEERAFSYTRDWTNPEWFYGIDSDYSVVLDKVLFDENGGFWLGGATGWTAGYNDYRRDAFWMYFYDDGSGLSLERHIYAPMSSTYSGTIYSTNYPLLYDDFVSSGDHVSGYLQSWDYNARVHLTTYSGDDTAGTLGYGFPYPKAGYLGDDILLGGGLYDVSVDGDYLDGDCYIHASDGTTGYGLACDGKYTVRRYVNAGNTISKTGAANFTNGSDPVGRWSKLYLTGDGGFVGQARWPSYNIYGWDAFGGASLWSYYKVSNYFFNLGGDSNAGWDGVIMFNGNYSGEIFTIISDDFDACPYSDWACGQEDGTGGMCNEYDPGIPGVITGEACRALADYGEVCAADDECKSRNCLDTSVCGGPTSYCDMNPSTDVDQVCIPTKVYGEACTRDAQCNSGKCINGTFLNYYGRSAGQEPSTFWGRAYDEPGDSPDLGYQELGICAPAGYECSSTLMYSEPRYNNSVTQDGEIYTMVGYEEVICGFDEDVVSDSEWQNDLVSMPINNVNFTLRQKWCNIDGTGYGTCESYYDDSLDYSITGCSALGIANFQFNIPETLYYRFAIYASHSDGSYEFVDQWESNDYCDGVSCSGSLDLNGLTGDVDQDVYIKVVALNYDLGDFCAAKSCASNIALGDYVSENIIIAYDVSCWVGPTTTTTTTTTTTLPGATTTTTLLLAPQDNVCDQYCVEIGHAGGSCSDTVCEVGVDSGCYDSFQNLCSGCASGDYCRCAGGDPVDPGAVDTDVPICTRVYDESSVIECSFRGHDTATDVGYTLYSVDPSGNKVVYGAESIVSKLFSDNYYHVDICIDSNDGDDPACKGDSDYVQFNTYLGLGGFVNIALKVIYYDSLDNILDEYPSRNDNLDLMYFDGCLKDLDCSNSDCYLDDNTCTDKAAYKDGYPRYIIINNKPVIEHRWDSPTVCKVEDGDVCEVYYDDSEFAFSLAFTDHESNAEFLVGSNSDGDKNVFTYDHILSDFTWADIVSEDFIYVLFARPDGGDVVYAYESGTDKNFDITIDPCDDGNYLLDCTDGQVCSAVSGTCGYGASGSCSSISCNYDYDCDCQEDADDGGLVVGTFCFEGICRPQVKTCTVQTDCSSVYPYLEAVVWEGTGAAEFYCGIRRDIDVAIDEHYYGDDDVTIPIYSECEYKLPTRSGVICIDDFECISGKCSNDGAVKCDGIGSDPSDNTCAGGILGCNYLSSFISSNKDNVCFFDGERVGNCLDDDLCYDFGECVDASEILCDDDNWEGVNGDLLCQGPSGLNDPDAYCGLNGVCTVDPVGPGDLCRSDDWCDTGYECLVGSCVEIGYCPFSRCAETYMVGGEVLYKGRGLASDVGDDENCGCGDGLICVPYQGSLIKGICKAPLLNDVSCGEDNTLAPGEYGDYLCDSFNCIGDAYTDSSNEYSGTCYSATTKCLRNVDIDDDSISWDPEEYCHCKDGVGQVDGDLSPCSTIGVNYNSDVDEILSTKKWCYNNGAPRPAAAPENPDFGCYDRLPEGFGCSSGYQCLSGSCVSGSCARGIDDEGSSGDICYIRHVSGNDLAVWDKYSNGETSDNIVWSDTCGNDLYCDPCGSNGYLVSEASTKCDDPSVNIYDGTAGICRNAKYEDEWCYSASQCLGYDISQYNQEEITTVRCVDEDGSGDCSDGNPFCTDDSAYTYNRFCIKVTGGSCTADEREPYNQFTIASDDSCYNDYLRMGIDSFCDDRHKCYIEGNSGEIDDCEDIAESYDDIANLVHANDGSKCIRDYCEVGSSGESYLSADCMRDPDFIEFHVNEPTYEQEKAVVYCDGDAGMDGSTTSGGLCRWRRSEGSQCEYPVECMYGLECLPNGKCGRQICSVDADCSDSFRCISGRCEYVQDGGFAVVALNGFSKPQGSPFVPGYDYIVSCDNEDYTFKLVSDVPMQAKYSVDDKEWVWFGASKSSSLKEITASIPDLCSDALRSGGTRYDIRSLRVAPVINDAAVDEMATEKLVLVLHQGLEIEAQRCYGSDIHEQCGVEEDRDKFVLISENTYVPSGTEIDDPRRFKCDSAPDAGSNYDNPIYPRETLVQFGEYRYALIQEWSEEKYFKCVDEFGYVYEGSALVNPAEFLFDVEFSWEQQIIIMLILLLGVPTLVLAGTRKVIRTK